MDMPQYFALQQRAHDIIESIETYKKTAAECKLMSEQLADLWFLTADLYLTLNELRELCLFAELEVAEKMYTRE